MLLRRALLPLLLSATTLVTAARAEPSTDDLEQARLLLRQGNELRAAADLRGALARYQAAHALVGTPITGFEVGRTHVQLGELVEGYTALTAVAKIPTKPKESANTTTARTEADRLAREVEARIPTVRVLVRSVTGAVAVQLDGKAIAAGVAQRVNPGKHNVVAESGGVTRASEVTVAEREARDVELAFGAPAASPPATVTTTTTTAPSIAPEPSRPAWIWIGFGVAGASAVVGAVSGVMTLYGTANLSDRCPGGNCPPAEHERLDSTQRWATVSTISFAIAGAAAAVSIVGLLATPTHKTETSALRPTLGLGTIGLEGSF